MDINKLNIISRPDINMVFFISDVHFGAHASSIEWLENMTRYFREFFIPNVKRIADFGKFPCVVIAGDYFDNRQNLDINVMSAAISIMKEISDICPVYMIIGNHDIYKKQELDVTSLNIFNNFNSKNEVTVIYEITKLDLSNGFSIIMVPWVGDFSVENKIISKYANDADYIVMHTEISGMSYDNGREIVDGINCNIFNDVKILSGHIHKRQTGKKAIYFGSPYHMTRSDIGNDKGIYSIDTATKILTFEMNDFSPKFVSVRYSDIKDNDEFENSLILSNNYADIVMTEKEAEAVNMQKLMESLGNCHAKKIEIVVRKEESKIDDSTIKVQADTTMNEVFIQRLSLMELNDEQRKELNHMNEEYLKLASEQQ